MRKLQFPTSIWGEVACWFCSQINRISFVNVSHRKTKLWQTSLLGASFCCRKKKMMLCKTLSQSRVVVLSTKFSGLHLLVRGHTLSMTAIFWPFLTPSGCKMTSFLLYSMTSLLLILTANHQSPSPGGGVGNCPLGCVCTYVMYDHYSQWAI